MTEPVETAESAESTESMRERSERLHRAWQEYAALPIEQRACPPADYGAPCPVAEGTRVQLVSMHLDPDPVPVGTRGTVTGGNGGQVWVKWDDGRSLNLLPGADQWRELPADDQGSV